MKVLRDVSWARVSAQLAAAAMIVAGEWMSQAAMARKRKWLRVSLPSSSRHIPVE